MNHALGRWLKAGALIFVAVFVIAACEGAAGLPGEPGAPGAPGAPAPVPPTPAPETPKPITIADVPPTLSITPTATKKYGEVKLPASHKLSETSDVVEVMAKDAANAASPTMNVWKVMALKKGMAEVMVLDGSDTSVKTIMVTVTADLPVDLGSCPSTITLDPGMPDGDIKECTLMAGLSMQSGDQATVRVGEKFGSTNNVWVITGLKKTEKTPVTVYLIDNTGSTRGKIPVTVLNQAPKRTAIEPPGRAMNITLITDPDDPADYMTGDLDLESYFTDADGDTLKYKVKVSNNVALVKGKDGFATYDPDDGIIALDMLRDFGDVFTLAVDAYDSDDVKASGMVMLRFNTESPTARTDYSVDQYAKTGNIDGITIGNRLGVAHTLTVYDSTDDPEVDNAEDTAGFVFAENFGANP